MVSSLGGIGIAKQTIISIFVECILYGVFLSLFSVTSVILLKGRKAKNLNVPMLSVSIIMIILATVHVAVDLQRILFGFLYNPVLSEAEDWLARVNNPTYVLKSTAYAMQTVVGDAFILYRLRLIWEGDRRVVYPMFVCLIASTAVGIGALQGFAKASSDTPVFIAQLQQWIVSFFSLTLFTNFTCTTLIAGRIWLVQRRARDARIRGGSLAPAAIVVIESGAIYSFCLIVLIALYASKSFAQYIVLDAMPQLIGVVFSFVIVRVGLGLSTERWQPAGASLGSGDFSSVHVRRRTSVSKANVTRGPAIPPKDPHAERFETPIRLQQSLTLDISRKAGKANSEVELSSSELSLA